MFYIVWGLCSIEMSEPTTKDFFIRNSRLFTVIGVFGAISVYFTQLDVDSQWRRLGIVSSLTIFFLVAITIQRNVSPPSSDQNSFDYIVNRLHQQSGLTVFYVAFYAVVISVVAIVLQYSNTVLFLLQFLLMLFGVGLVVQSIKMLDLPEESLTLGEDPRFPLAASYILRNAVFALVLGSGFLTLAWIRGMVSLQQLYTFQVPSPASALVTGVSIGFIVAGLLYTFTWLVGILGHYVFAKLDAQEALEWYEEFTDAALDEES